jgi:hypothetical protein
MQVWSSPPSVEQPPKCGAAPQVWSSPPNVEQPPKRSQVWPKDLKFGACSPQVWSSPLKIHTQVWSSPLALISEQPPIFSGVTIRVSLLSGDNEVRSHLLDTHLIFGMQVLCPWITNNMFSFGQDCHLYYQM